MNADDVRLDERVLLANGFRADARYPLAVVNVTNRCNLACAHCFIYREANPNRRESPRREPSDDEVLAILQALRVRHGIDFVLWMGGEPLLRRRLVAKGVPLFPRNHVVTNGTLPLLDLGPNALYVVSLDGPEAVNDRIRGAGTFRRVMRTLGRLPAGFLTPVQAQCTVTRTNQDHLEELVLALLDTPIAWLTFSFYVPHAEDHSGLGWATLEERMVAIREVERLKARWPHFIRNRRRALELMAPEHAPAVTSECATKRLLLPLYLDGNRFTTPFCCYGNDVDCALCGSWVVFEIAAGLKPAGRPLWAPHP